MACSTLLGVCLLASILATGLGASVSLEADDYAVGMEANRTIDRSNAGNKKNLLLYTGESIEVRLCVNFPDTIQFETLYYSNDGTADAYVFEFDGQVLGNVTSQSNTNEGNNWNVIEESGPIGEEIEVPSGEHTLRIIVEADDPDTDDGYGAEIDRFVVRFNDEANGDLSCVSGVTGVTEETSTGGFTEETSTNSGEEDCEGGDC